MGEFYAEQNRSSRSGIGMRRLLANDPLSPPQRSRKSRSIAATYLILVTRRNEARYPSVLPYDPRDGGRA